MDVKYSMKRGLKLHDFYYISIKINSVKEIDIDKNCKYYFLDDMVNIKTLDSDKTKTD